MPANSINSSIPLVDYTEALYGSVYFDVKESLLRNDKLKGNKCKNSNRMQVFACSVPVCRLHRQIGIDDYK